MFQHFGKLPESNIKLLNNLHIGFNKTVLPHFIISIDTESIPGVFPLLEVSIIEDISYSVINLSKDVVNLLIDEVSMVVKTRFYIGRKIILWSIRIKNIFKML